jgi:hypothetical protein
MGSRGSGSHAFRAPRSDPGGRELQNRARIADLAARLIAEHGLADWSLAKRKAARQLMLEASCALPGDDEIEAALIAHHALFGGAAHAASLRQQRAQALQWMRDLAAYEPVLTGGVAAGWASEHSDIRIELVADDAKAVELALINRGVPYRAGPASPHAAAELYVDTPAGGVRLVVRTAAMARQRPRRDRQGRAEIRLDTDAVSALLKS